MKKNIRAELLKKRDAIPSELRARKNASIRQRLFSLEEFRNAKNVMMYVSFRSEADTVSCLSHIIASGKKLILPVVDSNNKVLKLYEVRDVAELVPGYMGIPEPGVRENREVELSALDLIIIPGAGFDMKGNRIGYGGGYYDKLLSAVSSERSASGAVSNIPLFIALAFEEQIAGEIPSEPHDIKMDIILTDGRMIHCSDN
ncbi:MAG: 5-formyltetrahydrofolate cyclo-ligase [Nitrospirota bacterium]